MRSDGRLSPIEGEVFAVDKPLRWTSFDVVKRVRAKLAHRLGMKKIKVGHAGTLDPLASGVLVICTGRATKRIDELQAHVKEYVATLRFGATTPSFDLETEVDANYDATFNTEDGSSVKGMIFYKEYATDLIMHNTMQYLRSDASAMEATKQGVNMFLMQNGKPVHHPDNIGTFSDETMFTEFKDRDYRLYFNIMPPYVVKLGNPTTTWTYADQATVETAGMNLTVEEARYYIDLMEQIAPEGGKRLPASNWAGNILNIVPHFAEKTNGGVGAIAPMKCYSGYFCWNEYNTWDKTISGSFQIATADKPIFMIEEVLLNYAEAKYEKGEFDQSVADQTINKLRPRVNVANMNVSEINASFDPDRDPSVDPVLWEIRRERFTELFGQGFGFYDIRRWKTAPWWINQQPMGVYMRRTDEGGLPDKILLSNGTEGYIVLEPTTPVEAGKGWDDTFYLYPIPTTEFALNPGLTQNPGWERF